MFGDEDLLISKLDDGELSALQVIVTDWFSLTFEGKVSWTFVGGSVERKQQTDQKDSVWIQFLHVGSFYTEIPLKMVTSFHLSFVPVLSKEHSKHLKVIFNEVHKTYITIFSLLKRL